MKVSWIKLQQDKQSFRMPQNLGFDVFALQNNEEVDKKIDELITDKYNTIIVSNEVAGLSEKINKEYLRNKNVNIIISRDKNR